ncbi:MAG: YqaJ viral recombinase family protein [Phycisphaerales bacterium JB065]
MALTPEQLEERRKGVGASDIPPLFGQEMDGYKNPHDVWIEKVHGLVPEKTRGIDATTVGNCLEDGVLQLAEHHYGFKVLRDNLRRPVEDSPIVATLDGYVVENGYHIPVEAKTTGMMSLNGVDWDEWGETDSDGVPDRFILQVTTQCMATKAPYGYLAALIGGLGPRFYKIPNNPRIAAEILRVSREFWDAVKRRTPPTFDTPSLETLKRMNRVSGSIVRLPRRALDPILEYEQMKQDLKVFVDARDELKGQNIVLLGDAESAYLQVDRDFVERLASIRGITPEKASAYQMLSFFEESRTLVDSKKLAREYPDAYEACKYTSTSRVLRLRRASDEFIEAAADKPLIDPDQLHLQLEPGGKHDHQTKEKS